MDLLARLGGPAALARVTDALYERLLTDAEIGPLFAPTHPPAQRERLTMYLVAAVNGDDHVSPGDTPAARLRLSHYGQGVTDRHFDLTADHLAAVVAELGIDAAAGAELLTSVAARRADIVSASRVPGKRQSSDPTAASP